MQSITEALHVAGVLTDSAARTPTPQVAEHPDALLIRFLRGLASTVLLPMWNGRRLKNRYVSAAGQLDTFGNIKRVRMQAHFEINDVESLRPHCELTLWHRVSRLAIHHEDALRYISASTWCAWRLFMAACGLEFQATGIGGYQVPASKRACGATDHPLTRDHLYLEKQSA